VSRCRGLRPGGWAACLFVLNLALGLAFCFAVFPHLIGSGLTLLDPDGYGSAGRALYETGRLDAVDKAPLYPAFIALVSWLAGGYRPWVVQAAQCLLAALTCVLLYALFRRLLGERLAPRAGLACALYPVLIWYTPRLWTETFLTCVLAALTLAVAVLLQQPTLRRAALCGLLTGIAALSKGIALVFLVLIPLVLLLRFRAGAWRWAMPLVLAAVLLIAPWTWHTWAQTGRLLPIHAGGGFNLYLGNGFARHWSEAPLSYTGLRVRTLRDAEALYTRLGIAPPADPLALDRVLLAAALAEFHDDPLFLVRKLALQALTFWYLAADAPKSLLTGGMQLPVVLVALPGITRALRRRAWALVLLLPVVGIAGVSLVILAFARLSAPVMPYLLALAVYGVWPARD
jgi:4-amino-4-deoxy-L-arabinose transferase-like glycosyltransferase